MSGRGMVAIGLCLLGLAIEIVWSQARVAAVLAGMLLGFALCLTAKWDRGPA